MKSHRYQRDDYTRTRIACAADGTLFHATNTHIKSYKYTVLDDFAEEVLYIDRYENLLEFDRRH